MNNQNRSEYEYFFFQCKVTKKILLAKRNYCFTRLDHWCPHLDKLHPKMILCSYPRYVSDEELQQIFAKSTWPHPIEKISSSEAKNALQSLGLSFKK